MSGTHYIQNVSVAPGDVSGEAEVSCDFVNGTELMGYLAIANGGVKVGYMVAGRRSRGENQVDIFTNLTSGEYKMSIFAVSQTGLPEILSVNLPRNLSIMTRMQNTEITDKGQLQPTPKHGINVNLRVLEPTGPNMDNLCFDCTFTENDLNSTCVVIVHPCGVHSWYPGLFNISVTKFVRIGNNAAGCIDLSHCEDRHYVAVFYFNEQEGMIDGSPLTKMSLKTGTLKCITAEKITLNHNLLSQ